MTQIVEADLSQAVFLEKLSEAVRNIARLNKDAFSHGRMCSRLRLLSTRATAASSLVKFDFDDGHGLEPRLHRRMRSAVPADDLEAGIDRPNDERHHDAVLADALDEGVHSLIVAHLVRMPRKGLELRKSQFFYCFVVFYVNLLILSLFYRSH